MACSGELEDAAGAALCFLRALLSDDGASNADRLKAAALVFDRVDKSGALSAMPTGDFTIRLEE